jgi:hypothetical protein
MRDEKLARLSTRFDLWSELLTIAERGIVLLEARLSHPDGRRAVARFFEDFLDEAVIRPLPASRRPTTLSPTRAQSRMHRPASTFR